MKTAQATTPRPVPRAGPNATPRATLSKKTPTRRPKAAPKAAPKAIQIPRFAQIPRPAAGGGVLLLVIVSLPRIRVDRADNLAAHHGGCWRSRCPVVRGGRVPA